MEYNTQRPKLLVPEYGRNIQRMVELACSVKDKKERTNMAHAIVQVMAQLHPQAKDMMELKQKLWDHLFLISDYKLDVDSPFPKPKMKDKDKGERVEYPKHNIRYKHYGKTVEELIKAARKMKSGEEKDTLVAMIANLMKRNFLIWNRESVEDTLIIEQLKELSEGELKLPEGFQLEDTQAILAKVGPTSTPSSNKKRKRGSKHRQNRRRKR